MAQGSGVDLLQEDISELRGEIIACDLPETIQKAMHEDTNLYVTLDGGDKERMLDLVSLAVEEHGGLRRYWGALSQKLQQDASQEVEKS